MKAEGIKNLKSLNTSPGWAKVLELKKLLISNLAPNDRLNNEIQILCSMLGEDEVKNSGNIILINDVITGLIERLLICVDPNEDSVDLIINLTELNKILSNEYVPI